MADTADLIVLGAYFGTGNKGNYGCSTISASTSMMINRWDDVCVLDGLA